MVRPLWQDDTFKKIIEDGITTGQIDNIVSSFDSIMGNGSFEDMSLLLDHLYDICEDGDDKEIDSLVQEFQTITKTFKEKVKANKKVK